MPRIMQLVPIDGRLGVVLDVPSSLGGSVSIYTEDEISALLAVEREACAKIVDDLSSAYVCASDDDSTDACIGRALRRVAEHIRNRSN